MFQQDNLDNSLLPTLWEQIGESPSLFQNECVPVHKARPIKARLGAFGVAWPIQRPDFNPMEHLWYELERRLQARPFLSDISVSHHKCWINGQKFPQSENRVERQKNGAGVYSLMLLD